MEEKKRNKNNYYRRNNKNRGKKDNEPHPLFDSCIKLEKAVESKMTESNIATAIGISWNKYAWFEEKEATAEPGTEAYQEYCENTDAWCEEYYKMIEKLKSVLGINGDATFALPELKEIMLRNGYEDIEGLWKKKNGKTEDLKQEK